MGNLGDVKWLGGGIGELRIDVAAGYRVYFAQKGQRLVLLLVGFSRASRASAAQRLRGHLADPCRQSLGQRQQRPMPPMPNQPSALLNRTGMANRQCA